MILKDFCNNRVEYLGGDLTDVHLKKFMDNAEEIMRQVRGYLIKSLHGNSNETKESIEKTCDNVTTLLVLWDGVLLNLYNAFSSEKQCNLIQGYINTAMMVINFPVSNSM